MKVITQKQKELAVNHAARLLQRDGWTQTKTVAQWLDDAELQPGQFQHSQPALDVLQLLGFGTELVQAQRA
jgi:hypothetical protein